MMMELMFVKGVARGATPADVEMVSAFGHSAYRELAQALFHQIDWTACGIGSARTGEVRARIEPSDTLLRVTIDGEGDLSGFLLRAAALARSRGIVTIDVGGFAVLEA